MDVTRDGALGEGGARLGQRLNRSGWRVPPVSRSAQREKMLSLVEARRCGIAPHERSGSVRGGVSR